MDQLLKCIRELKGEFYYNQLIELKDRSKSEYYLQIMQLMDENEAQLKELLSLDVLQSMLSDNTNGKDSTD